MIYLREGADAALSTAKHLLEHHQELVNESSQDQAVKANMKLVHQMLRQKLVQFEVWRLRVTSLEQRMQNVINLVGSRDLSSENSNLPHHIVL